jgi:hypothetical protein
MMAIVVLFLAAPAVYAEDANKTDMKKESKTNSPFSGPARGGMTYSPTQGWIKTSEQQVKSGTDYLVYGNKKAAQEENRKKREQELERLKALKAARDKAWEDAQKAEASKKVQAEAAKNTLVPEDGEDSEKPKKKKTGKRVLVG